MIGEVDPALITQAAEHATYVRDALLWRFSTGLTLILLTAIAWFIKRMVSSLDKVIANMASMQIEHAKVEQKLADHVNNVTIHYDRRSQSAKE